MPVTAHIQDFQSLKDATIVIDGFTVVSGTNNTGKSACLRAIRAAFQNARGTSFIRHGATKCIVEIDFGDGNTLHWEKGRGKGDKPTYIINGGPPIHPGQGIPEEVAKLGVHPILVGKDEVWPQFAPQFTGQLFLVNQPGSVLAEAVSDVERVSRLNQALRLAESDKRSTAAELKVRIQDEKKHADELARFEGLADASSQVEDIEARIQQISRIEKALDQATRLRDRLTNARKSVDSLAGLDQVILPDVTNLTAVGKLLDDAASLVTLRERYVKAKEQVLHWEACLAAAGDGSEMDVSKADRFIQALDLLESLRDRYLEVIRMVEAEDREIERVTAEVTKAEDAVKEMLGGLEACPVCGAAIDHNH